ncbi:transcriptional regulator [Streptomyces sp. ZEA17I]|nr:transcriptional regulator [Streptomyces sp. ZEA17I]
MRTDCQVCGHHLTNGRYHMDVRLLGCVQVHTSAGKIMLHTAVRRFLASLAWSPGSFVSDEVMIERLWATEVPQHPRQALYTYAARLRQALDVGGSRTRDSPLVRRPGGYLFDIERDSVDLFRFRNLSRSAKSAAYRGDSTMAVHLFDDALALWHGDPLSDLDRGWAEGARICIRREYRAVIVGRAEASLCVGRHEEHLPALHQLAADYPEDERIAGLLMLSLYRSGRQGEALACFSNIRSRLIRQLGDEPGSMLQILHSQVLRRDPELSHIHGLPVAN